MFETVTGALAAVAFAFALFGAMMPCCSFVDYCFRHVIEMKEAVNPIRVYKV